MSDFSVTNLLENLREGFLDDLPGRVNLIESEVMASKNVGTYDELFRMVHSLKGSAGSYDYHVITKIAHDMEDVMLLLLQKNKFGSSSTIEILLKFIDLLRDTTELLRETKAAPLDIDERLEVLRGLVFKESLNVLVLEPSKLYAEIIGYSLQGGSINFTFVTNGLQALDHLLQNKYDLLITSLESSRLNGDALVAALRLLHNFNRNIKVVLITSQSRDKIVNLTDFDEILDRKTVKDGGLNAIIESIIS